MGITGPWPPSTHQPAPSPAHSPSGTPRHPSRCSCSPYLGDLNGFSSLNPSSSLTALCWPPSHSGPPWESFLPLSTEIRPSETLTLRCASFLWVGLVCTTTETSLYFCIHPSSILTLSHCCLSLTCVDQQVAVFSLARHLCCVKQHTVCLRSPHTATAVTLLPPSLLVFPQRDLHRSSIGSLKRIRATNIVGLDLFGLLAGSQARPPCLPRLPPLRLSHHPHLAAPVKLPQFLSVQCSPTRSLIERCSEGQECRGAQYASVFGLAQKCFSWLDPLVLRSSDNKLKGPNCPHGRGLATIDMWWDKSPVLSPRHPQPSPDRRDEHVSSVCFALQAMRPQVRHCKTLYIQRIDAAGHSAWLT